MNQRTLPIDPEPEPSAPAGAPPLEPSQPALAEIPAERAPPVYAPVVPSSDRLWERKLRWWRTRERLEAARAHPSSPDLRE